MIGSRCHAADQDLKIAVSMSYQQSVNISVTASWSPGNNCRGLCVSCRSPRPVSVELLEQIDENDGLPEIFFQKTGELLK